MLYSSSAVGRELIHNRSDCWYVSQWRLCLVTSKFFEVFEINEKKQRKSCQHRPGKKSWQKWWRIGQKRLWPELWETGPCCTVLHVTCYMLWQVWCAAVMLLWWDEMRSVLGSLIIIKLTRTLQLLQLTTLNTITVNTLNWAKLSHCYNMTLSLDRYQDAMSQYVRYDNW